MNPHSIFLFLSLTIFLFTGCRSVDDSFSAVRDYIHGLYSHPVSTTMELSLNTDNLGILKNTDTSFELEKDYDLHIREITRIEFGIYKPTNLDESELIIDKAMKQLPRIERMLKRNGYYIVKDTDDKHNSTIVLIRETKRNIKGAMYIVHFSSERFILAKVHGTFTSGPSPLSQK